MADPLQSYLRSGYPKESLTGSGYSAIIEYIGTVEEVGNQVTLGEPWGDYRGKVEDVQADPIPGTDKVILTVRVTGKFGDADQPGDTLGEEQQTTYEIEWVNVQKALIEHPVFSKNEGTSLDVDDLIQLEQWRLMPRPEYKADFLYYEFDITKLNSEEIEALSPADLQTLSPQAQNYAIGELKGIEYYIEKAPVLRMSTIYKNGIPPAGDGVGLKSEPIGFPNAPTGYEYVKESDRSVNTGKQNEWRRDQEWIGADKVLVDSQSIYYL